MKRLLATLLSLSLIFGFGVNVFAAPLQEGDGEILTEEIEENPLRPLTQIDTKLVGAPTVIENIATTENLINLNDTPVMQGAWLDIGKAKDMDAVPLKGDKVALSYFMTCMEKTIPILKIDNAKTAESAYYYLLDEHATDYIVASKSTAVLEFFGSQETENVFLAYIAKPKEKAQKIAETANSVGANICILETADRETVEYLQSRFLSVTLFSKKLNTRDGLDVAVNCGANGVVVNSAEETYKLYEKVKKTTHIRKPFIISNQVVFGSEEATFSLKDLKKVYKNGADSVKVNIKLNSENNLICWWNSSDTQKATTFKEICAFLSKQETTKTLILKIEQGDTDLIKKIKSTAKKEDALDRILIDTTDEAVKTSCREIIPQAGFFKTYGQEENDYITDLLYRGVLKAVLIKETENETTESEITEGEEAEENPQKSPLDSLKTTAKSGAVLIATDYPNLNNSFKKSIKLKSPLDIFGPVEVTKISINKITLELRPGKTKTLKATIEPDNATYKTVTFKSDNPKVASVDKNGVVTANRGGKAVITATAKGGKFVTCVVTVKGYLPLILTITLILVLIGLGIYFFKIKKVKIKIKKIKLPTFKRKENDTKTKPKHF